MEKEREEKEERKRYLGLGLNLCPFELAVVEFGVDAFLCQQFLVLTLFHDAPVLHHQDPVSLPDGGEAVGDDEASAAFHQIEHGILDQHLGVGIHRTCGFIQYQYSRVG